MTGWDVLGWCAIAGCGFLIASVGVSVGLLLIRAAWHAG